MHTACVQSVCLCQSHTLPCLCHVCCPGSQFLYSIYIYIFSVLYLLFSFLRVFVCLVNCLSHPSLSSFLACVISASRLQCSCAPGLPLQCTTPFKIKQSTRSAEHTVHNKLAAAENAKFTTNPDYEWRTVLPMSG